MRRNPPSELLLFPRGRQLSQPSLTARLGRLGTSKPFRKGPRRATRLSGKQSQQSRQPGAKKSRPFAASSCPVNNCGRGSAQANLGANPRVSRLFQSQCHSVERNTHLCNRHLSQASKKPSNTCIACKQLPTPPTVRRRPGRQL